MKLVLYEKEVDTTTLLKIVMNSIEVVDAVGLS
jgi:hypothetical protein